MENQEAEIMEAEIVEDNLSTKHAKQETLNGAEPVRPAIIRANEPPPWHTPGDHARPYGDRSGLWGGFLVLAVGFVSTILVLLVSVCIIIPFTILMRIVGVQKNK